MLPREGTIVQLYTSGNCITDHCSSYRQHEDGSVKYAMSLVAEGPVAKTETSSLGVDLFS